MQAEVALGSAAILAIDQLSKVLARAHLRQKPARFPLAVPLLNRAPVGRAFGLRTLVVVWLFSLLALYLPGTPLNSLATGGLVAAGVALGGATGNLFDLLVRGGVVDFIDLRVWPLFNLADVALVVGVGGVVLLG